MLGKEFGEKLHILRVERGWTCHELGAMIGRTHTTVSAYEAGEQLPTINALKILCRIFGDEDLSCLWEKAYDKSINEWKCRRNQNMTRGNSTLCWGCMNAYAFGCSWFMKNKPVNGWVAKRTTIHSDGLDTGEIESYRVIQCPQYQYGRAGKRERMGG